MIAFKDTKAGAMAAATITDLICVDGTKKVREHLRVVTENVYQSLPSGDYGRGDVRRMLEQLVKSGK